ncbi:MAG: hypothetical protein Q4C36_04010 [Coriobacteriia bacterium]|nr:hypothetical protein [Coriobacteriia bacterium]
MSEQAIPAPTAAPPQTSAVPLCNMIVGLLIITQFPVMFGMISGEQTIWLLPWILCAYPMIIICVVKMFRDGAMMDATINGVLSVVLMGQNAISAAIWLAYSSQGTAVPPEVLGGMALINGVAFLAGACILLPFSYLLFKGNKIAGVCVACAGIGFLSLFPTYWGIANLGLVAGIGLTILGVFLLIPAGVLLLFPQKPAE